MPLIWIILSTVVISLIAFIGILVLFLKEKTLDKITLYLVALSAGALMGGAFLHLIPESIEAIPAFTTSLFVLIGFIIFFIVEKTLHWRHCHKGKCEVHTFAYMNLIGDLVHNFIDGLIIAASFIISIPLGLTTTLAVAIHEIPQEIGDFGVLIYGKIKKRKALMLNFLVALTAILGGIVGFFLAKFTSLTTDFLIPFAAGGFIYIAASDLIPELKNENLSFKIFLTFIIGIGLMLGFKYIFG